MRKRNLRQCQNCFRWREDVFFGLPQSTACIDCIDQIARSARRRRRVSADDSQSKRLLLSAILVLALLMSLAVSHLHDLASFKSDLELAREAYNQLVSEQIALRERLEEIEAPPSMLAE